jgi:hypothetical protein
MMSHEPADPECRYMAAFGGDPDIEATSPDDRV